MTDAEIAARAAGWVWDEDGGCYRSDGDFVPPVASPLAVGPLLADLAAEGWKIVVRANGRGFGVDALYPGDAFYCGAESGPTPAAALVAAVAAAVRAKGGAR